MITHTELQQQSCQPLLHSAMPDEIAAALEALTNWKIENGQLVRTFAFKNYHQTLDFVNKIADIIHHEDHHPELVITYNRCIVRYITHSVNDRKGGLSNNDFVCAAKVDAVFTTCFAAKHD